MADLLTEEFEKNRPHLRGVAYRMLGSLTDAEDAVQEAWLRLSRSNSSEIQNLGGWLTTVVARVCLDVLRSRQSHPEKSLDEQVQEPVSTRPATDPEAEALLANSVGLALLVVLDTLPPAERLAFVLHDLFDLSFDEIAGVLGRTSVAARQLASRARRRVRGADTPLHPGVTRKRKVADAFIAAVRSGDLNALIQLLDPDAVFHSDRVVLTRESPTVMRGAAPIAARAMQGRARFAQVALVDGDIGIVVAPRGRLWMVIRFTLDGETIAAMEAIADPARLQQMELAVLSD